MQKNSYRKNRESSKHVEFNKPNSSKDKKGSKKLPPTYQNFKGEDIE